MLEHRDLQSCWRMLDSRSCKVWEHSISQKLKVSPMMQANQTQILLYGDRVNSGSWMWIPEPVDEKQPDRDFFDLHRSLSKSWQTKSEEPIKCTLERASQHPPWPQEASRLFLAPCCFYDPIPNKINCAFKFRVLIWQIKGLFKKTAKVFWKVLGFRVFPSNSSLFKKFPLHCEFLFQGSWVRVNTLCSLRHVSLVHI